LPPESGLRSAAQPKRIAEQIATEKIEQPSAPTQPKRIAAARKRSEVKRRSGRKRKAHKEEGRSLARPPVSNPLPVVNRDGLTESEFEERLGWGGYGIDDGQVGRNFSEDDTDAGNI